MRRGIVAAAVGIVAIFFPGAAMPAPVITGVKPDKASVPKYERLEIEVGLGSTYANPFDPDQIDLSSEFTSPSGKKWKLNGFWDGTAFKIRFAADEPGAWKYAVTAKDPGGSTTAPAGTFTVSPSGHHGWVRIASNRRYFRHDDGAPYHGMGLAYPWNVKETVLDSLKAIGGTSIVYWNSTFDGEGNGGGRYLIESIESGLGRYDIRKSERVDQVLAWCEARGMTLIFCIWPHGFLGDEINPTRKVGGWEADYDVNPYETVAKAKDFFDNPQAWDYQRKLYRYMLARWSYSRALEHWWTIVESPGTDGWVLRGPAVVESWAQKVHDYLKLNDPFGHPTSGSQQGNLENYWANGYKIFDLANREIYFNGSHFTSVTQETEKLWAQFEKPVVIGEIGNYISVKTFHQALWAGLGGGAASAPYWWNYPDKWSAEKWDRLKAYISFARTLPFGSLANPKRVKPTVSGASAFAIQSDGIAFGWMVNENGTISGKSLSLPGMLPGPYRLEWYDTWKGEVAASSSLTVGSGGINLQAPSLDAADIAFRLTHENPVSARPAPPAAPEAGASGSFRTLRSGGILKVSQALDIPFRASLAAPDGKALLQGSSDGGRDLELSLRGIRPGLHFLRIEWRGGRRVQALVL